MSETVQTLLKRFSTVIVLTGAILLILGASGNIGFANFTLKLANEIGRWSVFGVGLLLLVYGVYLGWRESSSTDSLDGNRFDQFGLFAPDIDTHPRFKLGERLRAAKTVELLGYNLKSLLQEIREPIADAVTRGATVRIILVDITKPVSEIFKAHSNRPHLLTSDWVAALEHIRDIQDLLQERQKVNGIFEVKLTTWIPSCNLILLDSGEETGLAKIGIHSLILRQPLTGRLILLLNRKKHQKAFDYFVKGFDTLWNKDSEEWDGHIPSIA